MPRRLSFNSRRFGTPYRFYLHRQVDEECQWHDVQGIYTCWVGWIGGGSRKWAHVRLGWIGWPWEGGRVYIIGCKRDYCFLLDGCLLSLSFWRSGFHDLLRLKPPSLFMLFGCISISMASLMRWSLYLVFVERSLVACNLMMCSIQPTQQVYIPCTSCHWHSSSTCLWRWNR